MKEILNTIGAVLLFLVMLFGSCYIVDFSLNGGIEMWVRLGLFYTVLPTGTVKFAQTLIK